MLKLMAKLVLRKKFKTEKCPDRKHLPALVYIGRWCRVVVGPEIHLQEQLEIGNLKENVSSRDPGQLPIIREKMDSFMSNTITSSVPKMMSLGHHLRVLF
jgi:hypothetical protein